MIIAAPIRAIELVLKDIGRPSRRAPWSQPARPSADRSVGRPEPAEHRELRGRPPDHRAHHRPARRAPPPRSSRTPSTASRRLLGRRQGRRRDRQNGRGDRCDAVLRGARRARRTGREHQPPAVPRLDRPDASAATDRGWREAKTIAAGGFATATHPRTRTRECTPTSA